MDTGKYRLSSAVRWCLDLSTRGIAGIFKEWLWSHDPTGQEAPFNSVLLSQCSPCTAESVQQKEQAGKSLFYERWQSF